MKKYRLILILTVALMVLSAKAVSAGVDIEYTVTGAKIVIKNLITTASQKKGYDFVDLVDLNKYILKDSLMPEISINAAVPYGWDGNYTATCFSKRKLGKFNILALKQYSSKISMTKIGQRRNVSIANFRINPFDYNLLNTELSIIDSLVIDIKYDRAASENINYNDKQFFSDIINKNDVDRLRNNTKDKATNHTLGNDTWFDYNTDYLRFSTRKDGIAKVSGASIIQANNSFSGKSTNKLNLLFKGYNVPIYIEDANGILDAGDNIYFIGKHSAGDTTYYENYDDYAHFFLYASDSNTPLRFAPGGNLTPNGKINSVKKSVHFERDSAYFEGQEPIYPDTRTFEGWYWKMIERVQYSREEKTKNFAFDQQFFPADDSNLDLKIKYTTLFYFTKSEESLDPHYKYRFTAALNTNPIAEITLDTISSEYIKANMSAKYIPFGSSRFNIVNYKPDDNLGLLGIDYIEYSYNSLPVAFHSTADFKVEIHDSDKSISVSGFSGANVIVFDTLNMLKYEVSTSKADRLAASVSDSAFSAVINDSLYWTDGIGYFAFISKTNNTCISRRFTSSQSNEFIDFIKNSGAQLLSLGYNGKEPVPGNVVSYLSSIGATQIANLNPINNWVMTVSGTSSSENVSDRGYAKVYADYPTINSNSYTGVFAIKANQSAYIVAADENGVEQALVDTVGKTNLRDKTISAEGVYITHRKFAEKAIEYANYRTAQGYKIKVVTVDDISNQFGNGKKSPHSIKAFLQYAFNNWQNPAPSYVLIFGDACWDPKKLLAGTISNDYVPSYGRPVSDYWIGELDGDDEESEMIVGRIPANEVTDVDNYLDKVKSFETIPRRKYMKNFLFLSGGLTEEDRREFNYAKYLYMFDVVSPFYLCADTVSVAKISTEPGSTVEMPYIRAALNNGAIWTTFLGHASSQVFDMDGWNVENLSNKDRYGVLSTVSCNTGAFAEPFDKSGRNEKYVLGKDKGFVAAIGATNVGFLDVGEYITYRMMTSIADSTINLRRIGDILYYGKEPFTLQLSEPGGLTRLVYGLLGDPMVKIRIADTTSLFIEDANFSIANYAGQTQISEDDEYSKIKGVLLNNGYGTDKHFDFLLLHTYNGITDTLKNTYDGICNTVEFSFDLLTKDKPGNHSITLVTVFNESGNKEILKQTEFTVYSSNIGSIDPLPYWNIKTENPIFRFINPLSKSDKFEYYFELFINEADSIRSIIKSSASEITETKTHIDWTPKIILGESRYYTLKYYSFNVTSGLQSSTESIPVNTFNYDNADSQTISKLGSTNDLQLLTNNSLLYDKVRSALTLDKPLEYNLLSIAGDGAKTFRWAKIYLDTLILFDNDIPPGIRVVKIKNKLDSIRLGKQIFDTWDDSSASPNLIYYLRDSVEDDDYVMIAVSGSFVRWSVEHYPFLYPNGHIGYLDTLKAELKKFGAAMSDSLRNGISYVFIGKRGAPIGSMPEKITQTTDSATISGKLDFYLPSGEFVTPEFGNALRWNSVNIDYIHSIDSSGINIEIYGTNKTTGKSELINSIQNASHVDLSSISAQLYPRLFFKVKLYKNQPEASLIFNSLSVDFVPTPELAITQDDISIANDNLLRGDTSAYSFTLRNISLRSNVPLQNITGLEILKSGGESALTEYHTYPLSKNSASTYSGEIVSDSYDMYNTVKVTADNKKELNELYLFNNSTTKGFSVFDDKIKPTHEIKFDGIIVSSGDYITENPVIDIDIFDNSNLPIEDAAKFGMRVNGEYITNLNTPVYEFTSYGKTRPLKASVRVVPDTLKYYENSFHFYFADYNNNRDTIKLRLKLASVGKVNNCIVAPNPSIEDAKIMFDYESRTKTAEAQVQIVSSIGTKVVDLKQEIGLGKNTIIWDGRDQDGNLVASGVYYFRLDIKNGKSIDPTFGKIVRIR